MDKENKIISFEKRKKKNTKFRLISKISIYICRKDDKYTIERFSSNEQLTEDDVHLILQKVLSELIPKVKQIEFKKVDFYEIEFTLLYYENGKGEFTYICIPQDMDKKKLIEYLLISTQIYELEKAGKI